MKYNYKKDALKTLSVGPFLAIEKTRDAKIEAASDDMPVSEFNANRLAKALHPKVQYAKIKAVKDHSDAKSFTLVPDGGRGTNALAYFRAGQYVSVYLNIGGAKLNKPYSISSNPGDALGEENTSYTLTAKKSAKGYASDYILDNWKEGDALELSAPLGEFYYERLRDADTVIGLAGGSGITPFYSMACAIATGIEDFRLTILYGSRTRENILLKDELDAVAARSDGKVKVVHVLSDEEADGFEHGFLSADIIKKYTPSGDYSIFMCGPREMYDYEDGEIEKLGLKRRRVRRELFGEFGDPARDTAYPEAEAGKSYQLTVDVFGEQKTVSCRSSQTLLSAMEDAGIDAPSHCRSGDCGWCHSRLVSGEVFVPESVDGRRLADVKFGWVHPCCTYPLSDITLEVPVITR
jgi:ferredoxin-NADP reductase